jgi:hypothetical protein
MSEVATAQFFNFFESEYPGLKRAKKKSYALMTLKPESEIALVVKKNSVKVEFSSPGREKSLSTKTLKSWAEDKGMLETQIAGRRLELAVGAKNKDKLSVTIEIPFESKDHLYGEALQADVKAALDLIWNNLSGLVAGIGSQTNSIVKGSFGSGGVLSGSRMRKDLYKKLESLWREKFKDSDDDSILSPLVPVQPVTEGLLFVGMNPSFSAKEFRKWFKEIGGQGDIETYYSWRNWSSFDPEVDIGLQDELRKKHRYFKRFDPLSEALGFSWEHIDLFFVRETNQKTFSQKISRKKDDSIELLDFGEKQFQIACELIEAARPKCIVVVNALASRIYQECHAKSLTFCNDRGCYIQRIADRETPVFLCSMLTGQRALDNFSFERLQWHLAKVLQVEYRGGCRVKPDMCRNYL